MCIMDNEAHQKWLAERRMSIGASDAASVLGCNPWSSQIAVWADKTGLLDEDFDDAQIERMRWGHLHEPAILAEYALRRGVVVERHDQTKTVRHPSFPDVPMSCTPDAYDDDGRLVQAKFVGHWAVKDWGDGVPLYVNIQEQHEMAVTGANEATVAVLFEGQKLEWFEVDRNDAFIESLEMKLTTWWKRYVVNRIEPPVDASDSSVRALERLHPSDNGEEVMLAPSFVDLSDELTELKARQKLLTGRRKEIENEVKAAIGSATFGMLPGGAGRYSWKSQDRKEYTVKASTYRVLRRSS